MPSPTTRVAEFVTDEPDVEEYAKPTIAYPTSRSARVKGTWTMYFGTTIWDFVDGHRYDLPLDLFEHLRKSGNIYDTMA